ncbi:MAG: phosphodiester glycosidase family protein, partial [Candidatus Eremiobacteraeota bacterium]|nr:phosphodiester glycosidase family protein [Candidatus Eremiobacteraeota bacterium]
LAGVTTAIGGGPLLLQGGKPYEDPNAPAPEERLRRFPVSGAALTAEGTLLLVAVDGRDPQSSVGLTRPEFGALMRGLGATDGMAFDSGGSSTLVARRLGDGTPSLLNAPSDGVERPVADGLFVYSDAPIGQPTRLVVHPSRVRAVRGARVRVTESITDEAGHLLGTAPGFTVDAQRSQTMTVRNGTLRAQLPVDVVDRVASLRIDPQRPNPDPNGVVQLIANAADPSGRPIDVSGAVRWSAQRGGFIEPGLYRATSRDDEVTAVASGLSARTTVLVGRHDVPMPWFGAQGLTLNYDFTKNARFAYANGSYALPGDPLAFSVEIDGDASGVAVRAAFVNRLGERTPLTLAQRVDWHGWQRRTVVIPGALNPPLRLVSLYAVNSLNTPPVHAAGALGFRNPSVVLPGQP